MDKLESLKKLLDEQYDGKFDYLFKFIIPKESVLDFKAELPNIPFQSKESKNGKYISITFKLEADSSAQVIDIYKKVSKIPGIISL